ncbi:guanyl-specific ribonuclease Sa/cold shock CspA family protein [Psychrobacter luti]|uniref:Guanyl-specific ribonuclease Sa/cold shock CspA family protein n=1 Tax=Psychrobacter luti TaxID=198481 RepID=A0A839TBD1_9GAMM|nr:ribonuclease domain-containing protein [Psychrobacter luti]MBB3106792.1 guanyl-specific ribonuclease Sa/cold shock CspA family protein [Psychrobacter luti]
MQSGKIKHWNADKGYGFIEVDNQSEDVFFHISTVRLSQPISEGQRVYFNSQRNEKNQLRATEVTSDELSILETSASNSAAISAHHNLDNAQQKNNRYKNTRGSQNKKSGFSTLLSVIALIAVAVYFFGDLKSSLFTDSTPATSISQTASKTSSSGSAAITGDAQIDQTLALIKQGGPFPYPNKDGTTFYNREGKLPAQSQGYYREYTVPTPGVSHRGARRIVTGGHPPTIYYLTVDHYDSFRQLQVN